MRRGNLHTHTTFCDGVNTPEELVGYALSQGCTEIGFSGHSYTDIPDEHPFCMSEEGTLAYRAEINRLKEKYKGRIQILLGVEQDYFSPHAADGYDYVIGSVHYVRKDGVYLSVDDTRESQERAVREHYNGDFYAFAEDYYALVGDLYRKTGCDIVGHFDLITKFNEGNRLFDTNHPRYIAAADAALEKLLAAPVTFEINHGAVARGYRTTPYPEERILQKIRAAGKPLIHTSDCHRKEFFLFGVPDRE